MGARTRFPLGFFVVVTMILSGCTSSAAPEGVLPLEFYRLENMSTNGPSAFSRPTERLITDSPSWEMLWGESSAEEVPPLSVDLDGAAQEAVPNSKSRQDGTSREGGAD